MTRGNYLAITLVLVLSWGVGLVGFRPLAAGAELPPTPAPSPSVEPTGTASAALVKQALRSQGRAARALLGYKHAARCFARHVHLRLAKRPPRQAATALWLDALRRWKVQAHQFNDRTARLIHAMKNPPGAASGTKWIPLARFVGWPEYTLSTLARIIYRESTGREGAANSHSSARGLLQLMSGWWTGAWGPPAGNPLDATYNLRTGLWIWKHGGWSAWALTY